MNGCVRVFRIDKCRARGGTVNVMSGVWMLPSQFNQGVGAISQEIDAPYSSCCAGGKSCLCADALPSEMTLLWIGLSQSTLCPPATPPLLFLAALPPGPALLGTPHWAPLKPRICGSWLRGARRSSRVRMSGRPDSIPASRRNR